METWKLLCRGKQLVHESLLLLQKASRLRAFFEPNVKRSRLRHALVTFDRYFIVDWNFLWVFFSLFVLQCEKVKLKCSAIWWVYNFLSRNARVRLISKLRSIYSFFCVVLPSETKPLFHLKFFSMCADLAILRQDHYIHRTSKLIYLFSASWKERLSAQSCLLPCLVICVLFLNYVFISRVEFTLQPYI